MKIYDVPLAMFGYMWKSLHIMSYPKDGGPYQGGYIVYCVSFNQKFVSF